MAKLTCDSLLDLTSNANIVTGSPVPYNRFMKYICQKQFWKQILALWGEKNEYSIFQIHVKILQKEIKFIHIVDLRSGCKKRNDCKNQPYHQVFMKNTIINHLQNRISQRIRRARRLVSWVGQHSTLLTCQIGKGETFTESCKRLNRQQWTKQYRLNRGLFCVEFVNV